MADSVRGGWRGTDSSSSEVSTGSTGYDSSEEQGWDLNFDPEVDSRYECPICLLVLRNPVQTECGHRFCQHCILRWISEARNPKCPIDNHPLSESQVFPDNFAKREINVLTVKCVNLNHGCTEKIALKDFKDHLNICEYTLMPCPNRCSGIFYKKDLEHHLRDICSKRLVKCQFCFAEESYDKLQTHLTSCPRMGLQCEHCDKRMLRQEYQDHLAKECVKIAVSCILAPLGCNTKLSRRDMADHMESSTQVHMTLLVKAVSVILNVLKLSGAKRGDVLQQAMGDATKRGDGNPLTAFSHTVLSDNSEAATSGYVSMATRDAVTSIASVSDIVMTTPPGRPLSLPTTMSSYESHLSSIPESAAAQHQELISGMANVSIVNPNCAVHGGNLNNENQVLRERIYNQDRTISSLSQEVAEVKGKSATLKETITSQRQQISNLQESITDFTGRNCNGIFLWRIDSYSRQREEATSGRTTVIHSPPFYTSFYGYRLCARVNLNGVDKATGTHLSLFVHFLKGEFDPLLEWPFSGRISMSILDQNEDYTSRRNISESFQANPSFAAFQRPQGARNHKGFGYMEFAPLSIINSGTYIVNDCLAIRIHVQEI